MNKNTVNPNVDNTKQLTQPTQQRVLSLCTGIGGIERGIEAAGTNISTVAYVEIESFIIANLVQQMEQGSLAPAPIFSNLKTFNAKPFRGRIHGITGGYPCQPFSHAGQRKGTEDPRHLWPYIREIVHTIRPVWCLFENVEGHINLGYGEVYRSLRDMGYIVEAGIFSAEEVGAPHSRKRLFILAVDELANRNDYRCAYSQFEKFTTEGGKYALGNISQSSSKELEYPESRRTGELQNEISQREGFRATGRSGNNERNEIKHMGNAPSIRYSGLSSASERTEREGEQGRLQESEGAGTFSELGNAQHDGQFTTQELPSCITPSYYPTPRANKSLEFTRTSRSNGKTSLSRCNLANATDSRYRRWPDNYGVYKWELPKLPPNIKSMVWGKTEGCSRELSNTSNQRLQSPEQCRTLDERRGFSNPEKSHRATTELCTSWPARPSEEQYRWEEPRTLFSRKTARMLKFHVSKHPKSIPPWQAKLFASYAGTNATKPQMGLSVDGYNFRTDLLRALGNAVVSQTAQKAWITLWQKHLTDLHPT